MIEPDEIKAEVMRTIPRGALWGPIAISDGIPKGWIVCDGLNGTSDLRQSKLVKLLSELNGKEYNYVMKV